ncbi:MAG: putative bifunctional diguanylate cyclase/phosphodiesterase [Solirubrobacterales bacterium]
MSDQRVERTPHLGDAGEHEIQLRLASVRVGMVLSLIVCLGSAVYALVTWDQPNRSLIMVLVALGLLSVPLIWLLPVERIVRGRRREAFFLAWSVGVISLLAVCASLDGGSRSAYALLLVLPFLFASLSYPLRTTILVGVVNIAAFLAVALGVGGGLIYSGFGGFALLCVALLSGWEARNQGERRAALAGTAEALQRSERTSRQQTRQQRQVASFGQFALGGAPVEELEREAARIVASALDVELAGILRLLEDGRRFLLAAAVGVPDEMIGTATIPAGFDSQSGYALATGAPVVVPDWDRERRFGKSPLAEQLDARSGVSVLIKGRDAPYGVLGILSTRKHDYSVEDISFLEAIANVLANAVERRRDEERTRHEALHDPLTGLPNRNLFLDRLQHALEQARRHDSSVAVLFLDLDQFKLVNDSLGHAAGDELLASVAPRLEQALRPGDTVARFGGDEFAILAEDVSSERGAIRVAERIAEALTKPFIVRRREHFVSASIGISIGGGAETPGSLIRDADAALYRAKEKGRGGYEIFDEVMRSRVVEHMQIENDLRRAIQRQELLLHYQPVIRLHDGAVIALEALLRWQHPERGLIGPAGFIPVAEESRLIVPIGRWVLEEACIAAAEWQARDPDGHPVGIAVNLSARQLADPALPGHVEQALRVSDIDPSTLRLELTESTLLEDTAPLERTLASLKRLGCRLVLDDFGIGFSSLGYLTRLPLSAIKLDRSFVEKLADSADHEAIVRAINEMADAIGIRVVAEGVETEDQLRAVQALGCGYAQGFYFAEPVPAGEVDALLNAPSTALD